MKKWSLAVDHFEIILFIWMNVKKNSTYLFTSIIQVPTYDYWISNSFYNIIVNENIFQVGNNIKLLISIE